MTALETKIEVEEQEETHGKTLRRKLIKKQKKKIAQKNYVLVWTPIQRTLPLQHLIILPGDCIFPLSNISMFNLMEDLYIKNSSIKCEGNLQLTLSRKVKPFRSLQHFFPLIQKISSPYIPKLKHLLFYDYKNYIENKKSERKQILGDNINLKANQFENSLFKFLKSTNEEYYRYQIRSSNQQYEMQMKKVGYSQNLINLLYPESTDILVENTPMIFSNIQSYIKYMYYNLDSLVRGGSMDWVEIQIQTSDEILIQTRFKNIYFSSQVSNQLATITVFQISKNVIERIQAIRSNVKDHNLLIKVNPQAQKFFNKFYSNKANTNKQICSYIDLQN